MMAHVTNYYGCILYIGNSYATRVYLNIENTGGYYIMISL